MSNEYLEIEKDKIDSLQGAVKDRRNIGSYLRLPSNIQTSVARFGNLLIDISGFTYLWLGS